MSTRFAYRGFVVAAVLPFAFYTAFGADIDKPKDGGTSTNGFRPLVTDDRPAAPLLAPASNEGEVRIKQFKIAPGLKIDLWAAEPMLANPVAFTIDERGRVFTSETYRYRSSVLDIRHYMFMLEDDIASRNITNRLENVRKWFGQEGEAAMSRETEVIRLVEDTDHDGKADKSRVFADHFTSPLSGIASGVLARKGEVWVTEIPSLWRFKAEDGSPKAGITNRPPDGLPLAASPKVMEGYRAEELLRGFGVRFSFTGHDLHGLKFGPDGRLYFSCGDRGSHIVTKEGKVIDLPDEGAVFRCEPDGSNLEVVHRGLRNPQELAFNEYGDLFTGDNDSDQGDRERWVQVVEGADSGWRVGHQHAPLGNAGMWNMERLWVPHFEGQAAYVHAPIANIGDGPSGLVYDYGSSLPGALKGRFLLAYFKGTSAKSGVYSLALRQRGAGYELAAHDEFVWNSLVPDVDIAPDGSIFFADWHEGWPKSNKGRLYRAYFPEAVGDVVAKETAKMLGEGLSARQAPELLALLAHRDMRVRLEAQYELAGRYLREITGGVRPAVSKTSSDDVLKHLKKVAFESGSQLARIHAIWTFGQVARGVLPTEDLTPRNVITSVGGDMADMMLLLSDKDAEIRTQAARLFQQVPMVNAASALEELFSDSSPRVRAAAVMARGALAQLRINVGHFTQRQITTTEIADRLGPAAQAFASRHLKTSLGAGDPTSAAVKMLEQMEQPDPLFVRGAGSLIAQANRWTPQAISMSGQSRAVRMAGVLALRELRSGHISKGLSDADPLIVLEAARAINDVPVDDALPKLAALGDADTLRGLLAKFGTLKPTTLPAVAAGSIRDVRADQPLPWTNAPVDQLLPMLLRVVNANFRVGTPESAARLASLASSSEVPGLIRTEAMFALGSWANPPARDRVVGVFRPLPKRDATPARDAFAGVLKTLVASFRNDTATCVALSETVAALGLADGAELLEGIVREQDGPSAKSRAAALRAFARVVTDHGRVTALLAYAAKDSNEALRLEASKLNAELNPNDAAGQLAAKIASGSQAEQQSAYTSLGDLNSDAADALLAEALDKLMARTVSDEVKLELVDAAKKRSAAAVKTRLAAYEDWKLPKDHLSPYREALVGGNAERGRKIFYEHAAVACTRCHQIGTDAGGNAGPKLDGIASRATREHLLESIVFPNRQISPGFESSMITMNNSAVYAGVVRGEDASTLTIITPDEGEVKLAKADVKTRERGVSGMPEGFGDLLTRFELRDVIEFLGTLK